MPSVLENYIILETGVPARLHFTDHAFLRKMITDPLTGEPTTRNTLVFMVDRRDAREVKAQYSVIAEKHALQFQPYLDKKEYRDYDFIITKTGEGFRTSWSLQVIPRTK